MRYEILETDVGQGAGAVAVPVTYGKPVGKKPFLKTMVCQQKLSRKLAVCPSG